MLRITQIRENLTPQLAPSAPDRHYVPQSGATARRRKINQYVVILGAAVWQHGKPSTTLLRRTLCALDVAEATGSIIICTGGIGLHPPSEADVSAKIAMERGFPKERILIERTSTSTNENLRNALHLMSTGGNAIIITDRFHSKRALLLAREIGINAKLVVPDSRYPKSRARVYIRGWLREIAAMTVLFIMRHVTKAEKTRCD